MAQISVEQVQAGMVLAAEVMDKRGRLLIPAGRELDPKHVQALKMWGITRIEIQGDDPSGGGGPDLTPELLEEAGSVLKDRLQNLPADHAFTAALTEALLPRVAAMLPGGEHV